MALPLLALVLSAAPLEVRVLAEERFSRLVLAAPQVRCDEVSLPSPAVVELGVHEVMVGQRECRRVVAEGGAQVTVGGVQRAYPGALVVTLEGTGLRLVNLVDVEAYLPAVTAAQVSQLGPADGGAAPAPPSAVQRAVAIAARTFAQASRQRHAGEGYGLCDTAHCLAYPGGGGTAESRKATADTAGRVLLVGGVVLRPAHVHLACGGHTSGGPDVMREPSAGVAVRDGPAGQPACGGVEGFSWEFSVQREALARELGVPGGGEAPAFEPLGRDAVGRVLELKAFGRRFTGVDFLARLARAFGPRAVPSLRASAQELDGLVTFRGTGLGHGAGLCLGGAQALALGGADEKAILRKYFPDARLTLAE